MGSADDITSLVIGGGVVGAIRLAEGASMVGDVVGLAETENESSNEFGGRVGGDIGLAEGANVIGDAVGLSESSADVVGGGVGGVAGLADGADVMGDVVGLVESGADVMGDAVGLVESGADVVGDREMHELNRTHELTPHAKTQSPSIVYIISRTGGQYHSHWSTHGAGLGGAVCCFVARGGGGQKNKNEEPAHCHRGASSRPSHHIGNNPNRTVHPTHRLYADGRWRVHEEHEPRDACKPRHLRVRKFRSAGGDGLSDDEGGNCHTLAPGWNRVGSCAVRTIQRHVSMLSSNRVLISPNGPLSLAKRVWRGRLNYLTNSHLEPAPALHDWRLSILTTPRNK